MKQYLKLKLNQKLSPQQIQLMKLIQLPTIDFEQKIKQELEENPALEIRDNSNDVLDEDFSNSNEDEWDPFILDDLSTIVYASANNYGSKFRVKKIGTVLSH